MTNTETPKQREKTKPDTSSLVNIAIYLEGYLKGKGDLYPLGTHALTVLWDSIKFINESEKR